MNNMAGFVPIGLFHNHVQNVSRPLSDNCYTIIVIAILAFSASTVYTWSTVILGNRSKALACTLLVEVLIAVILATLAI